MYDNKKKKRIYEIMKVVYVLKKLQAAEHVLGSVLCAPGCFSMYRCLALKKVLPKYASNVERAFDFLMKDMGEDRWLCTLMVQVFFNNKIVINFIRCIFIFIQAKTG